MGFAQKGRFVRRGTHEFRGDAGKHSDKNGNECAGRIFEAKVLAVVGIHQNVVMRMICGCELAAFEDRIVGPAPYAASA